MARWWLAIFERKFLKDLIISKLLSYWYLGENQIKRGEKLQWLALGNPWCTITELKLKQRSNINSPSEKKKNLLDLLSNSPVPPTNNLEIDQLEANIKGLIEAIVFVLLVIVVDILIPLPDPRVGKSVVGPRIFFVLLICTKSELQC